MPSPTSEHAKGWDEHRFVRLHVLLKLLTARSPGLASALSPTCGHATDFSILLDDAMNATDGKGIPIPPPGYEGPMSKEQRQALEQIVDALKVLAGAMTVQTPPIPFKPIPNPELRVRPPL